MPEKTSKRRSTADEVEWAVIEHLRAVRHLADDLPGDAVFRSRVAASAAALEELIVRRAGGTSDGEHG